MNEKSEESDNYKLNDDISMDSKQENTNNDFISEQNSNESSINNEPRNNNMINKLIEEETVEPDLMLYCAGDLESEELLKKCNSFVADESWTNLKNFLEENSYMRNNASGDKIIDVRIFLCNFYYGITNFKLKEYNKALSSFLTAKKIHEDYQLHYNIALCHMKLDDNVNAAFYLDHVIEENNYFFFAYYNLIKVYLKKSNINDAFLIYRKFSDIIKNQKNIEKVRAETGIQEAGVNRLSVLNFNTFKLFYKIGAECLFSKQLYQECVNTILEGLKFNPDDEELWFLYAKVFVMKKNFQCALPLLEKALDIEPSYEEARKLKNFLLKHDG